MDQACILFANVRQDDAHQTSLIPTNPTAQEMFCYLGFFTTEGEQVADGQNVTLLPYENEVVSPPPGFDGVAKLDCVGVRRLVGESWTIHPGLGVTSREAVACSGDLNANPSDP